MSSGDQPDLQLTESFSGRLLPFPFPAVEPPVEVVDLPGEVMSVRCVDAQAYFVPLEPNGVCDWCFYDGPDGTLTGVYECRIIGRSEHAGRAVLREWKRFTDPKDEGEQEWHECHYLIENDTWRWVQVERERPGALCIKEHASPGHPQDPPYEPVLMNLSIGLKWGGFASGEVVGVSEVAVGTQSWKCLKVVTGAQHFKSADRSPTVYAEWYVCERGRTVLFRRYNGPGYADPEAPTSFESLEGSPEIEFRGIVFRHYYDCLPGIALSDGLG